MERTVPPEEVRALIQEYLELVEVGRDSVDANEKALIEVLDSLALATHGAPRGEVTTDYDAPPRDYDSLRALAAARFPRYGLYGAGRLLDPHEVDELLVGDAIDDVADIARDLHEAAWTWDNISRQDGLWVFHHSFQTHWGQHLRELQAYLHLEHRNEPSTADERCTHAGLAAVKGAVIEAVTHDPDSKDWWFAFRGHGGLRVDCPWQILANGGLARASGDHRQQYGLPAPIDAAYDATQHLAGRAVEDIYVDSASADLSLRMDGDVTLRVVADSTGYEAWHLVAPDGGEFIGRGDEVVPLPSPRSEN